MKALAVIGPKGAHVAPQRGVLNALGDDGHAGGVTVIDIPADETAGGRAVSGFTYRVPVQLHVVPRGGTGKRPRLTVLSMAIGPGDDGEPVLTLMNPDED